MSFSVTTTKQHIVHMSLLLILVVNANFRVFFQTPEILNGKNGHFTNLAFEPDDEKNIQVCSNIGHIYILHCQVHNNIHNTSVPSLEPPSMFKHSSYLHVLSFIVNSISTQTFVSSSITHRDSLVDPPDKKLQN